MGRGERRPNGDTLQAWRAWMNYRIQAWMARRLSRAEAMHSVWSEAEGIWHRRHGAPPDPDRCAGCGEWMLDGPGMRFSVSVARVTSGDFNNKST